MLSLKSLSPSTLHLLGRSALATASDPSALPRLAIIALALISSQFAASADAVPPVMKHPAELDQDFSGVTDCLESKIANRISRGTGDELIEVIISLFEPPTDADIVLFESLGGVTTHRWEHAVYGFAGRIPATQVGDLRTQLGDKVCIVEANPARQGPHG